MGWTAVAAALLWALEPVAAWALAHAVWTPDPAACAAAAPAGACWGFVAHAYPTILFGTLPPGAHGRAALGVALLFGLTGISMHPRAWRAALLLLWAGGAAALTVILGPYSTQVGGLLLTMCLTLVGCASGFLLAIPLVVGRMAANPLAHRACRLYVELVRGLPMVTVLFAASYVLPLLLPALAMTPLARVTLAVALFEAAYFSEVLRAGLQTIPRGQMEAAATLGLSYLQTLRVVSLPQAIRKMLPALVNNVIGALKATSLVVIVGLQDLNGALQLALGDAGWRPYALEGYLFLGLLYFMLCYPLSRYARWLERRFQGGPS